MSLLIARGLTVACWLACILLLSCPLRVRAQSIGTMSGFVKDPSGAGIPKAKVTATLVARDIATSVVTNSEGFYIFPALEPADYTLTVEVQGFQRYIQTGLTLTVNQNLRVDATLQLGTVASSVTVTAPATFVDTTSATISGLVDDRRVTDLPLNGRNVISLATIMPGMLGVSANQNLTCARSGPIMDVFGGRQNMNLFTFDGAYFDNPSRNTGMNYPPPDALQEFSLQQANFQAEYGRNPGSQVNVVAKSGTNSLHGAAWEFLRNNDLNARNFFTATVPGIKENQFGAVVGGPIKKDKAFFFASYQGLRNHPQAVAAVAFVPSAAERAGNFSALSSKLVDPTNILTGKPYTDSNGLTCVANNIINPNCISPVTTNILGFVPQSGSGSVTSLGASPVHDDNFFGRIDLNLSRKNTVFGHVYVDHNGYKNAFTSGGSFPGYIDEDFVAETDMVTLNDTYLFSPTLVNQAVISYLRTTSDEAENQTMTPESLGINIPQYNAGGAVTFNVSGYFELSSGTPTKFQNNNYQIRDVMSWTKGRHTLKFGGEFDRYHFVQTFLGAPSATYTGAASGNALSDFMLGTYGTFSTGFGVAIDNDISNEPSFFAEDVFKANKRLTLTYGLRYEPYYFWYDAHNHISGIDIGFQSTRVPDAPPGLVFPNDPGFGRSIIPSDLNNLAPRLGFAWDVFGNGKTSVRGSYGIFYETQNADTLAQTNPPYHGSLSASNGNIVNPFTSVGETNPPVVPSGAFGCTKITAAPGLSCPLFPLPLNGGLFVGTSGVSPYIQESNLTIQRQITPNILVEAGYVGRWGTKIEEYVNFNPAIFIPGTTFNSTTGLETTLSTNSTANETSRALFEKGILGTNNDVLEYGFRSWYNAAYVQVTRRMSHGLSVKGSYTLAKDIDSASTDNENGVVSDPLNLRNERGRATYDRRNDFVVSYLWSPAEHLEGRWKNMILGKWTFSGITSLQSGLPITFTEGTSVSLDGSSSEHAFTNGQPIKLSHASTAALVSEFFNTGAIINPSCTYVAQPGNPQAIEQENCTPFGVKYSLLGQYGNLGRNTEISGPAFYDTDFAVLKDFPFQEQKRVEFRAEFFNIFNTPQFGLPNSTANSSSIGRITSAGSTATPARVIQFALKLYW